jgi:SEC-C motif
MPSASRPEAEIFADLEQLCCASGYIHVFAALVVQNTFVRFAEGIKGEDFYETFDKDHLIRTELSTLLGLMIKQVIDFTLPTQEQISQLGSQTLELLEGLHHSLAGPVKATMHPDTRHEVADASLGSGAFLREPIFYTGESAYASQYRDLAPLKYSADEQWVNTSRGFTIDQAAMVGRAILALEQTRIGDLYNSLRSGLPDDFTFLPGFTFTPQELLEGSGENEQTIINVLNSFSISNGENNKTFGALNDFNLANAQPIVRTNQGTYILFQAYSFYEALYESPFYWMLQDDSYRDTAATHRGDFTEDFSAQCLARVFGEEHTYRNVIIEESSTTTAGEIDNLVLFGNRAIVVQVKSKRLTVAARRGNDGAIRSDFAASISDSYEQALDCANHLLHRDKKVIDRDGNRISIPQLKKVYLLCLVLDHYPALSFQVGQFLKPVVSEKIPSPFVTDVFTLDVMTEMLASPLQLLSYIDRRTGYSDRVFAGHELTVLGYHLTSNLWLSSDTDLLYLHDDVASGLDAAMAVRRDGVSGNRTPQGILTLMRGSAYAQLVSELDNDPRGELVDLGFMLLRMGRESATQLSRGLEYLTRQTRETRGHHNCTIGSGRDTGLTIHCNYPRSAEDPGRLERHVLAKKYQMKAPSWFGVGVDAFDGSLLFGYNAEFEWEKNDELEEATRTLSRDSGIKFVDGKPRKRKVGRNDPCPCGSGKKYKKCHLNL